MVRQRSLNNPHWTQKTHKKPTYDKGPKTLIETSLQLSRPLIEIRLHFTSIPNSRLRPFPNASPAFATAGGRRIFLQDRSSRVYRTSIDQFLLFFPPKKIPTSLHNSCNPNQCREISEIRRTLGTFDRDGGSPLCWNHRGVGDFATILGGILAPRRKGKQFLGEVIEIVRLYETRHVFFVC